MSDSENQLPQLTKQEIKLIKLLRLQSVEKQNEIYREVGNVKRTNEHPYENENDDLDAYWLNTNHYQK